jgi:hypothetical protein
VYIGQWDKYEVDFVAEKHGSPHYYQVTMSLEEASVVERETRSLLAINDNYPKTIISMIPAFGDGIKGIEVIGLTDFLMKEL